MHGTHAVRHVHTSWTAHGREWYAQLYLAQANAYFEPLYPQNCADGRAAVSQLQLRTGWLWTSRLQLPNRRAPVVYAQAGVTRQKEYQMFGARPA